MNNKNINNYERHLGITCIKLFSLSFSNHLEKEELTELFVSLLRIFEQTYVLKYDPEDEQLEYLSDYVKAIASFFQFMEITPSDFFCFQRGVINMIKSFPYLQYSFQHKVVDGVAIALCYLENTYNFKEFIENVVYQGIVLIIVKKSSLDRYFRYCLELLSPTYISGRTFRRRIN